MFSCGSNPIGMFEIISIVIFIAILSMFMFEPYQAKQPFKTFSLNNCPYFNKKISKIEDPHTDLDEINDKLDIISEKIEELFEKLETIEEEEEEENVKDEKVKKEN